MILVTIEPNIAVKNPSTLKPSIKCDTNRKNRPLITKVNRPKVRNVIGSARIDTIGLIVKFNTPKMKAAHKATQKSTISIPGINFSAKNRARAVTRSFIIGFLNIDIIL